MRRQIRRDVLLDAQRAILQNERCLCGRDGAGAAQGCQHRKGPSSEFLACGHVTSPLLPDEQRDWDPNCTGSTLFDLNYDSINPFFIQNVT
jgi:hypothetical protein